MTPVQIVLLVAGILVVVALAQAAVWIPITRKLNRMTEELRRELEASGQTPTRGPERSTYRGSTTGTKVKGLGAAALTKTRLMFRPFMGRPVEVMLDQVVSVREDKWFLGSYSSGRMHLILKTKSGEEIGFMFRDHAGWMALFRAIAPPS